MLLNLIACVTINAVSHFKHLSILVSYFCTSSLAVLYDLWTTPRVYEMRGNKLRLPCSFFSTRFGVISWRDFDLIDQPIAKFEVSRWKDLPCLRFYVRGLNRRLTQNEFYFVYKETDERLVKSKIIPLLERNVRREHSIVAAEAVHDQIRREWAEIPPTEYQRHLAGD